MNLKISSGKTVNPKVITLIASSLCCIMPVIAILVGVSDIALLSPG